jgi:hypothetical protein
MEFPLSFCNFEALGDILVAMCGLMIRLYEPFKKGELTFL